MAKGEVGIGVSTYDFQKWRKAAERKRLIEHRKRELNALPQWLGWRAESATSH